MAITYFPFDGTDVYQAQWAKMGSAWLDTGVVDGEVNELEPYGDSSGMQVKVKSGRAWVKGHLYDSTAEEILAIGAADGANPRWDLIILEVDWVNKTMAVKILPGVAAGAPAEPALTQTFGTKWQQSIARVVVDAGAATIAAAKVIDQRQYANHTPRAIGFQVFGFSLPLSTGDGKVYLPPAPSWAAGYRISKVTCTLGAKSTGAAPSMQLARGRQAAPGTAHAFVDVLSTNVTIDANEYCSLDATTPAVINTANDDVAEGDIWRADVDTAGTAATGLWYTVELV